MSRLTKSWVLVAALLLVVAIVFGACVAPSEGRYSESSESIKNGIQVVEYDGAVCYVLYDDAISCVPK